MIISSGRSKIRSTVIALAVAALAVAGAVTVVTRTTTPAVAADSLAAAAALVEDEGADCPVPGSISLTANSRLPIRSGG